MAKPPPKHAGPAPAISGVPKVGETLRATDGGWSGGPSSYGKQWVRGNKAIEGATSPTYVPVEADVGEMILVGANATNSAGTSDFVFSGPVGPIEAASVPIPPEPGPEPPEKPPGTPDNTLPPVVEPPPSGDAPASITTPVVGTPLLEVWNLQFAGTGPKRPPDNGVWAGSLDAYLLSKGFYLGNYGNLMFPADVGQSNTVEAYDFSGAPGLNIIGGGNAILADCVFTDGCELAFPMDANNNLGFDTTTQTVTINNCTFDVSTFFQGAGKLVFNHCRFTKQTQGIGGSGFQAPGEALMVFNWCYITGGGIAPAPGAHVELVQMVRPLAKFECNDTLIILDKEGQTTNAKWGSGWTGVWSVAGDQTFTNMICLGLPAIDANPANPNVSNCVVAYGSPATPVLTNCVMEPGQYGYSLNQSGEDPDAVYVGPYPGINGGGNRTFDNVALADDDFG